MPNSGFNEPALTLVLQRLLPPLLEELLRGRDESLNMRLQGIERHQLEIYGNGSGTPGMLERMRNDYLRMHRENQQESRERLSKIEETIKEGAIRKEVMQELLDEQDAKRDRTLTKMTIAEKGMSVLKWTVGIGLGLTMHKWLPFLIHS